MPLAPTTPLDHPLLQAPLRRPFATPSSETRPAPSPALFIDRDGVINRLVIEGYVRTPEALEIIPEALEGLALAAGSEYKIVLLTNQSVVGRGDIPRRMLERIHARMLREVEAAGGRFDLLQVCPHAPFMGCDCRKPRPGMLFDAAEALNLDLARSWTIGDSVRDVLAGHAAGTRVGFVRLQGWHDEREWLRLGEEQHAVEFVAEHLREAVERVLGGV